MEDRTVIISFDAIENRYVCYIALFIPAEERSNAYCVLFPDLPGCITQGESYEEAFDMATKALYCHVTGMQEDGDTVPEPTTLEDILRLGKIKEVCDLPLPPRTMYQLIPVLKRAV